MAEDIVHRLTILDPEGGTKIFDVPLGITSVGRQAGNDLVLDHTRVSRRHAQFVCTVKECEVSDLGSSNGTSVNDEKLEPKAPRILSPGDQVKIGGFVLTYDLLKVDVPEAEQDPPAEEPEKAAPPKDVEKEKPKKKPKPPAEDAPAPRDKPRVKEVDKPPEEPPGPPLPPGVAEQPGTPWPSPAGIPGLSNQSLRLIDYLPGIYQQDFMSRFLALFESILFPIEWNIENFDLFLDPGTSPASFLPWLAKWYEIVFDPTWSEAQRRVLLQEAHRIYAQRGTKGALTRLLEIYLGQPAEIEDLSEDLDPFTFEIKLPVRKRDVNTELVEALVDAGKPAYTSYTVKYRR